MKGVTFGEDSTGDIVFNYIRPSGKGGRGTYYLNETVPVNIVKKGDKKIFKYVSEKINDLEERIKKSDEIEENIRKNHISIKAKYEGIQLQGRIVEATSRSIRVKLDRPLRGQSSINYGYGSAGQHVFTKDHNISENGYDSARRALCWAYEDALHAPQRKIVNRLNSKV